VHIWYYRSIKSCILSFDLDLLTLVYFLFYRVPQPGYVSFAKTGAPNSRSTQLFINYVDNSRLDGMGFSPFAEVLRPLAY